MYRAKLLMFMLFACGMLPATFLWGQEAELEFLKNSAGKWKAEIKMMIPGTEEAPVSVGTENNEMIGDAWVVSKFEGEFEGTPFKGVGLIGYDATEEKMVNYWVDSMSPSVTRFVGTYDKATKTVTMTGKDHMGEGKHTTVVKDAKTRVFTMYSKPEGADEYMKVMEITYTRQ
jgi:hypothetical protein